MNADEKRDRKAKQYVYTVAYNRPFYPIDELTTNFFFPLCLKRRTFIAIWKLPVFIQDRTVRHAICHRISNEQFISKVFALKLAPCTTLSPIIYEYCARCALIQIIPYYIRLDSTRRMQIILMRQLNARHTSSNQSCLII